MSTQLSFKSLTCELITPAFIGGSDPNSAELRVPSIKGALRFWWRALHGDLPIDQLKQREADIFGGTQKGQGQSKVILSLADSNLTPSTDNFPLHPVTVRSKNKSFDINILEYLAYGTYKREKGKNVFIKEYFKPGTFQLKLLYPENYKHEQEILSAFSLLSNFGGLGSRSRNGFGSIAIKNPEISDDPVSLLSSLDKPSGHMRYTALSNRLKLFCTRQQYSTWDKALAEIGLVYRNARGSLHSNEKRKYIASPSTGNSVIKRRAKPYFIHIAKSGNKYEGRLLFLPASFCAGLHDLKIDHDEVNRRSSEVWSELNEFFSSKLEVIM